MITIENRGSNILLYGRKGKQLYIQKVEDFEPYFYYEDENGKYISIDGKKLSKQIVKLPKDVPRVREMFKHYEADIIYTNRYIIDRIEKLEKEEIRICYIDIETQRIESGYESPEKAINPILMIGCYDSFDRERKRFCLGKTHKDEKDMLEDFIEYIKDKDPDMFIAWNGEGFDFPQLINRIKRLKIDVNQLSRNGYAYSKKVRGFYRNHIFGRICFDLMKAYRKMNNNEGRESWALDYISKYEKVGEKVKYKGELDELWEKDIDTFVSYNDKDVDLLVLLNEKLGIVDWFDEIRRLSFCKFEDVFLNTKIADCLCLKTVKDKIILPSTKRDNKRISFIGGFVCDSEPKLHKNIVVMDMKSLYPSIMIGFNVSYETYLDANFNNCINIDDKFYYKKEVGLLPSIVKPMLEKRKEVVKKMDDTKKNTREHKSLWLQQYALKIIANSFYGVLGCPYFRLFKVEAAQTITYTARKIRQEVHNWFEKKGFKVVYGDTDSVFINIGNITVEEVKKLNKEINEYFKSYFLQFEVQPENNIFKLEFEKVCKTVLFKKKADGTGVKKRYAGRTIWEEEEYVDKFFVVGFESKRSDSPQVGRDLIKQVLKMICYEQPKEEIDKYVEEFRKKIIIEFTPEEIGLPIGLSKSLNLYANQIHARAARLANEKHNAQIKGGDKIKYIYVKGPENVIAFKSEKWMWDGYDIDYDMMTRRIVDLKIGPLYDGLGWEYPYIQIKNLKKKKEIRFEDTLTQEELW